MGTTTAGHVLRERLLARVACLRPSRLAVIARDRRGLRGVPQGDSVHRDAALEWLCRAQDAVAGGGVSAGYHFRGGWRPPYPETSGYIVPTFLAHARATGDASFLRRAERIGQWEMDIQLPSGAVRGGQGVNDYPIVFNTGQVMVGWMALHRETGHERWLAAARRAADWLLAVQDEDGKWSRHELHDQPHAYHTRVAWPMLDVGRATGEERYVDAGRRFLEWVLSQDRGGGWYDFMAFRRGEPALTHTIAYTADGFLECAALLEGDLAERARGAAREIAMRLFERFERSKSSPGGHPRPLPATFDEGWRPAAQTYTCLTGNCQMASVWLRLHELSPDLRLVNAALEALDHVKATQSLQSAEPGIRGGIAGSFPIWGRYVQLAYPNWAAKFFVDALRDLEVAMAPLEETCA